MKECSSCRVLKAKSEFSVRKASPDGLAYKCRECSKRHSREWREKNPDAFKKWSAKNRDERAEYCRRWHQENREHRSRQYAAWLDSNRGRVNARNAARKKAVAAATPPWADHGKIEAFYLEAARLTRETGVPHEVDHIFPIKGAASCGLHCEYNLRVITKAENARKRNKMPTIALEAA